MVRAEEIRARLYFLSEAIGTVILVSLFLAQVSYVRPYIVLRIVSLALALWLADPGVQHWLLSLGIGIVTLLSLHYLNLFNVTAMCQGILYVAAGSASVKRHPSLALTWLSLGLFNLGFAEGWNLPVWANLNQWALAGIATIGFLLFAANKK